MVKKVKEYWFGVTMALFVLVFLIFAAIVAAAPHNDTRMRGFAPCTYQMAADMSYIGGERKLWDVFAAVGNGYLCYARVMREGMALFLAHKQSTPWANYLFEPEDEDILEEEGEPLSEDLLKANLFDEDAYSYELYQKERKEIDDGQDEEQ